MKRKSRDIDMINGSIADKILLFSLPLMASSLLQLLFNAADIMVVGRYAGKEALAAVGSNTPLINLLISLFVGLSIGTNVTIARDLGAGREEAVGRTVHTSIFMAMVGGVILAIFGFVMAEQMLVWMGSPDDVLHLGTQYLKIYFLGMPGVMVYNFGAAILRAKGDTRRPFYFLLLAGIVNVVLNLYFVIALSLSVVGVALATIIAQYISAALVLRCLMREEGMMRVDLKKLKLDTYVAGRILSIGLPAGVQGIIFSISNVLMQSTVNSFDSVVMSGSAASSNIEGFIFTAMNTFHQTALTFTGQNYGAGKRDRVDRVFIWCGIFVITTGLLLGNLAYIFGESLIGLYAPGEDAVIQEGIVRLGTICRFYFLAGIMDVTVGLMRGLGHSITPMLVSLVCVCGLRIVWLWVVFPINPVPMSVYVSYPVTWTIGLTAQVVMFYFVRKKAYKLIQNPNRLGE